MHDAYESQFTGDFANATDRLLSYRIFAPNRMRAWVCTASGRIAAGATIVQRVFLGPAAIECAVRVIEFESSRDRASFTYATVSGHPECGIESFTVTRIGSNVRLDVEAWSRPGHWMTIAGRPVSRALQLAMTREAIAAFPRA